MPPPLEGAECHLCLRNTVLPISQEGQAVYFVFLAKRSPSVQCWTYPLTAPDESRRNSSMVPSILKRFADCAINGIFPAPPRLSIRRFPSRDTTAGPYAPTY